MKPLRTLLPPGVLVVSLGLIYLATMAPDLTWANDGADGGDLIAAAATGGVAHPGGYPLYLLLAGLFQRLPLGTLAFRTNLMSGFFAAAASLLVYWIVRREADAAGRSWGWVPALAAGYAAGLSSLLWSQAVITEVYALQAFLVALILFLYGSQWGRGSTWQMDCIGGGVLGLAMGNHLTTLLLVPAAMLLGAVRPRSVEREGDGQANRWILDPGSLGRQAGCFFLGCLVYLTLPLRALRQPPVNWGNVITWKQFWWLVSGELYQDQVLQIPLQEALARLKSFSALFLAQFGLAGVILGIIGLVLFFRPTRLVLLSVWTLGISLIFAIGFKSFDSYVYLLPAALSFAIWIGLGIAGSMHLAWTTSPRLSWMIGVGAILLFAVLARAHWSKVDASRDMRAVDFGRKVLAAAPAHAMLFAEGDQAVFALWYFGFALDQRSDLCLIASDLLHHDWYQQTLETTCPDLSLPGKFPWPETIRLANPSRPACFVEYAEGASIDCAIPPE